MYSKGFYIEGYKRWLEVMNYDKSSLINGPKRVRDFIEYLEQVGIETIEETKAQHVKAFFKVLSERKSKTTGEVLSIATLRNYKMTLNRFARYLREMNLGHLEIPIQIKGQAKKPIITLTQEEIKQIYEACTDDLLGIRDRAMLGLFYGCGIRKSEAVHIKVNDILPDKSLLYVRKGKGNTERYVPLIGKAKTDIIFYLNTARPMMMNKQIHDQLLVTITGKALGGSSMYERIKKLIKKAGINKVVGLHSLRHSIATHLLERGMSLAEIAKFLGHKSLESTQIYTHIKDGLRVPE